MAAEKTTGIVLRVIPFSETSCIVTMFTRDFGKVTTMAKGARRPKSPFEAALDVLALCRIVFLNKNPEAMGLLTEAKLERRFRSATRSLDCLYAGYYIIERLRFKEVFFRYLRIYTAHPCLNRCQYLTWR